MLGAPPEAPPPPGAPPPDVTTGGWEPPPRYPVTLEFNGPERLSRLSTIFRLILAIPLFLFLAILGSGLDPSFGGNNLWFAAGGGALGSLLLAHWISVLVRRRPVSWIWGTMVAIQRFAFRGNSYVLLITDRYPAFEGDWYLQYEVERPERISRRQLVFWKALTSLPHFIVLAALSFAVAVCTVIGWFAIVFTGRFPAGLRNFVVGWLRWNARVSAYFFSLRDEFPPYSLSATASPGSRRSLLISAVIGLAVIVASILAVVAIVTALNETVSTDLDYDLLTAGEVTPALETSNVLVTLLAADDEYEFPDDPDHPDHPYHPEHGNRFVSFNLRLVDLRVADLEVNTSDFKLDGEKPIFATFKGRPPPGILPAGTQGIAFLVFEVPDSYRPGEFTYRPDTSLKHAKFVFH